METFIGRGANYDESERCSDIRGVYKFRRPWGQAEKVVSESRNISGWPPDGIGWLDINLLNNE